VSPAAVLSAVRAAGIHLWAAGDTLQFDAPAGAMTPELRAAVLEHRAAVLALLAPASAPGADPGASSEVAPATVEPLHEYISLRGGLVVPVPALQLALSLENRGFLLRVDADHQLVIQHTKDVELTEAERLALTRWHLHVAAIAAYRPPIEADPLRGRE
jgi:hypothetical protein